VKQRCYARTSDVDHAALRKAAYRSAGAKPGQGALVGGVVKSLHSWLKRIAAGGRGSGREARASYVDRRKNRVGLADRAPIDKDRVPLATPSSGGSDALQPSALHRILTGSHRIAEHLSSACEQAGVSLPLGRALQFLAGAEGPVTPTQLSRELGRSPAATSELVKRLVNDEQITADVDPTDRRSFHLAITPAGRARWNEVRRFLVAAEDAVERDYGKRRLNELASDVEELARMLDVTVDRQHLPVGQVTHLVLPDP